jgi:hypothetical protein
MPRSMAGSTIFRSAGEGHKHIAVVELVTDPFF